MFARISTINGSPGLIGDGIRNFRETVLPAARGLKGFQGAYLLVDRATGKAVGITLWETERDLRESTGAANRLRSGAQQLSGATTPATVEVYEVAVQPE